MHLPLLFKPYLELLHVVSLELAGWLYSLGQVELTSLHPCMHLHADLSARGPSIADRELLCRQGICQELKQPQNN